MKNKLYLLGFSGNFLSLIFNTLKELQYSQVVSILENTKVDDLNPFECDLSYERLWYENYRSQTSDTFFLSVGKPTNKKGVFNFFNKTYQIDREKYINIIHPSVRIANRHDFSTGIYIEPGCIISPYVQIGFGATINRGCSLGHHTVVGEFVTINPGVHIAGHCRIQGGVSIGIGSVIFEHVTIGAGSVIGGGSVVNKNIPAGVLAFGNPGKVVKVLEV